MYRTQRVERLPRAEQPRRTPSGLPIHGRGGRAGRRRGLGGRAARARTARPAACQSAGARGTRRPRRPGARRARAPAPGRRRAPRRPRRPAAGAARRAARGPGSPSARRPPATPAAPPCPAHHACCVPLAGGSAGAARPRRRGADQRGQHSASVHRCVRAFHLKRTSRRAPGASRDAAAPAHGARQPSGRPVVPRA